MRQGPTKYFSIALLMGIMIFLSGSSFVHGEGADFGGKIQNEIDEALNQTSTREIFIEFGEVSNVIAGQSNIVKTLIDFWLGIVGVLVSSSLIFALVIGVVVLAVYFIVRVLKKWIANRTGGKGSSR